jgi:hypothetical protein
MVQTHNTRILQEAWTKLYEAEILQFPPSPCSGGCDKMTTYGYRRVFFDLVQSDGPYRCFLCKRQLSKDNVVVDHIDCINNGFGSHNCPENLRALCKPCNTARGNETVAWRMAHDEEYAKRRREAGVKSGKMQKGKRRSLETRARMSAAATLRFQDPKEREKISKATTGIPRPRKSRGTGNRVS